MIDRGPAGPRGVAGPAGPAGEDAVAEVDAEEVMGAIEFDPGRVAAAVQSELDPAPEDVQTVAEEAASAVADVVSDLEDLRSDFDSVCSELSFADALQDVFLSC